MSLQYRQGKPLNATEAKVESIPMPMHRETLGVLNSAVRG
jgi:hypothetical protein